MGSAPDIKDKLLCGSLYLGIFVPVMSWIPILWIIVASIQKIHLKDFIKYHCYQAVLFNMIAFALPQFLKLIAEFLSNLLSITVIFENSAPLLLNMVSWLIGVYFILIRVLALYAVIWTARGRFTYIPPISQAVNLLLR